MNQSDLRAMRQRLADRSAADADESLLLAGIVWGLFLVLSLLILFSM